MKMKETRNISQNKAYDRLPVHRPDDDLWDQIGHKLDSGETAAYRDALSKLPVHKVPSGLWDSIEGHISGRRRRRALLWLGMAAAASLALFTVLRLPEIRPNHSGKAVSPISENIPGVINPADKAVNGNRQARQVQGSSFPAITGHPYIRQHEMLSTSGPANDGVSCQMPGLATRASLASFAPPSEIKVYYHPGLVAISEKRRMADANRITLSPFPVADDLPPNRNQTPESAPKQWTLALGYLPEALDNGYNPALFHNVDLTASLDMKKYRLSSSLGMAYISERLNYDVTVTMVDNHSANTYGDTANTVCKTISGFEGTESHEFISWDIGGGRKLFTAGKLTTWLNAGAGFAVRLDNTSLRNETVQMLETNYTSDIKSIEMEVPDYNRLNMSLATGIQFDYRLLKRISITLQPQAKYYFRPIFSNSGTSPDSFSLGFHTGMKFDF